MKNLLLTLCCVMFISISYAQSNKDIANVYIKRANNVIEESIDFKEALVLFEKAMKYMDTVTSPDVASLGARIYFELENYKEAQKYSKQFFLLSKNKKSEQYLNQLELFVTINEEIELQLEEEKRLEQERLLKEKELRRIDSLKTVWKKNADNLSIKVDSIYNFNKNSYALYTQNGKFGILSDVGEIIVEAAEYDFGVNFEGYILLQNKKNNPTKIYYYNTYKNTGTTLPNPSEFNSISTNFGQVMLPRSNGRLVTYPNNSAAPMVFDLNENKIVKVANKEDLLDKLEKNDIIRKYNRDDEVKIDKEWYVFGGHLGGGIHPLYPEGKDGNKHTVNAYLFSVDGSVLPTNANYQYLGAFYNSKIEALKAGKRVWLSQSGKKVDALNDKLANYEGNSKIVKIEDGVYQILKEGKIVKGKESLEKMVDFLRKFD
ncbi:tetratricopeptide repeat protein [Polaribacter aestuariivivens]|uniref:Tetratricopeptide repeat protein n=1 Tax=Polaribacter aestuariivivens TaxID=2304626 RepID=A0A5S3NAZ8_9FLAO|nr:tetratricopeptide repeat protein [Polaribacter aestuariivivens]TMM30066.1 tetratricopeptide repeat protein [Polaribacter aestuariivivens]